MVPLKESTLVVSLVMLLASAFYVWGQPACTSHFLPNNTVDIYQYNNTGLQIIQTLTTSGDPGMTDCSLHCCETENCSLVIFTDDKNNNCLLIHCISDEACNPIPSNTSQLIHSLRNGEINSAVTSTTSYTFKVDENTSASTTMDMTDNTIINVPSVYTTTMATIPAATTSVAISKNSTELSQSTATDLGSNNAFMSTSIKPDNATIENSTGLNASDAQQLGISNATSFEQLIGTTDNKTAVSSSNETVQVGEPVTEMIFLATTSPSANMTTSLENETINVSQNSSLTTQVTAIELGPNSTWQNSINASFNELNTTGHLSSANNTAKEEADSSEEDGSVAGDHSMMVILVATLSVGMLLFIAIVAVVSKKAVDGWQRRHYSRIDYLVNGMYN